MIDRDHELPLRRQAEVLQLSRSTLYYEPRPVPQVELCRRMGDDGLRRVAYRGGCEPA